MTSEINTTQEHAFSAVKNVAELTDAEQEKRGWTVVVNGKEIPQVSSVVLENKKMGLTAEYGKTEAGYDGLALEEPGGGGAIIIPYFIQDGEVYIGVVLENRPNMGGLTPNVPRGFLDPGETHFQTAQRELAEESGYVPPEARIHELGQPANPNSTFFVTKGDGKGVKPFGIQVLPQEVKLEKESEDPEERVFAFNPEVIQATSRTGEKVMRSQFIHVSRAVELKDMFSVFGAARLTHFLASQQSQTRQAA